jgi:peroxiredoxin
MQGRRSQVWALPAAAAEATMSKTARQTGDGRGAGRRRRGASVAALQAGQTAPDFSLPDEAGRVVSLAGALAQGPVVLAFLDGGDQKEAEAQLHAAAECAAPVGRNGGALLAISSHLLLPPADAALTLLRDADSAVAIRYGLGRSATGGARPATFVIDQTGMTVLSLTDAEASSGLAYMNVLPVLAALSRRASSRDPPTLGRPKKGSRAPEA